MRLPSLNRFGGVGFTIMLVALVAFAIADVVTYLFVAMVAAIGAGAAFFLLLFPGSRFFAIAFANFLAVYACFFVFFREANFRPVEDWVVAPGFLLPIAAFLLGAWVRRADIRTIVTAQRLREERHFVRVLLWLAPVCLIGAATFLLPGMGLGPGSYSAVFLGAMGLVALVVYAVSPDVCTFMLDSGLLFEEFFARIGRLIVPAFAFLTLYSLLVIVFAAIYRIIDHYTMPFHFVVYGAHREIGFAESLYFSLATISTVGYGDIVPASDIVRVIVAVQIVLGVVLLLFGFSEILTYSRDRGRRE